MDIFQAYPLPTVDFVGGASQDLAFHIYFHAGRKPFGLIGCSADFSVINFLNKNGTPIVSKAMGVLYSEQDATDNILTVTLTPQETVSLSGKYIYQITIRDATGAVEIPKQGILLISNNINKGFIKH